MHKKVLDVGRPYLGPATESFITRQCRSHLKIEPPQLERSHVKELARWMEVSAALIMDAAKAKELGRKIGALAEAA